MKTQRLGKTELEVSEVGFGTWQLGTSEVMNLFDNPEYRAVAERMKAELIRQRTLNQVPEKVFHPPYVHHGKIAR